MSEIQMLSVVWYGLPAGWLGQGQVVVVVCLALATDNDTSTQSIHLTRVLGGDTSHVSISVVSPHYG